MFFLNRNETDLKYINNSCLRLIFLKQNSNIKNSYILKLPQMKYYFIYKKIVDISLLKLYNNSILIWLLTGRLLILKNFFVKLERGIRYYRFFLTSKKIFNIDYIFSIFDFIANTLFFLIGNRFFKVHNEGNVYLFKLLDLEFFSNIRLANSFYTTKLNDVMYIYFFMDKSYLIPLGNVLKQFKILL